MVSLCVGVLCNSQIRVKAFQCEMKTDPIGNIVSKTVFYGSYGCVALDCVA